MFKRKISNWLLRHILNAIVLDDVIVEHKGIVYIGGKKLSQDQVKMVCEEVRMITETWVWRILNETIKQQAQEMMFNKSEKYEDIYYSKAVLYVLDLWDKICKRLK